MIQHGRTWLALCVLLALACLLALTLPRQSLDWQPTLASSQPWRWWTAALVHWNREHLMANGAGLVVVAALGIVTRMPPMAALAWLVSWPLTHLALLLRPELAHYGGLSGWLHGGVAVAATWAVATLDARGRCIAWLVLAGLGLKLAFEAPWGPALNNDGVWGFAVVPMSGMACALLALMRGRPQAWPLPLRSSTETRPTPLNTL
jgi:rhomboid family GlyGly-CTERM serine protease